MRCILWAVLAGRLLHGFMRSITDYPCLHIDVLLCPAKGVYCSVAADFFGEGG